jgi:hypothetical protein
MFLLIFSLLPFAEDYELIRKYLHSKLTALTLHVYVNKVDLNNMKRKRYVLYYIISCTIKYAQCVIGNLFFFAYWVP